MASVPEQGQVSITEPATGRAWLCWVNDINGPHDSTKPFQARPGDANTRYLACDAEGHLSVTPDGSHQNTWFTRIPNKDVVAVQQAAIANPVVNLPAWFGQ